MTPTQLHDKASELYHLTKHETESGRGIERIVAALSEADTNGRKWVANAVAMEARSKCGYCAECKRLVETAFAATRSVSNPDNWNGNEEPNSQGDK